MIDDAVAAAALDLVLAPLGTSLRHYMPITRANAVKAMRGVLEANCAHEADQRLDSIREAVGEVQAALMRADLP